MALLIFAAIFTFVWILQEALPVTSVCPALPKVDHIVRAVNHLH